MDADKARPYKVPGGDKTAIFLACICIVILALSIVLFLYTPGEGLQLPVVLGALAMIFIGEGLIRYSEFKTKSMST